MTDFVRIPAKVFGLSFLTPENAAWLAVRALTLSCSNGTDFQTLHLGLLSMQSRDADETGDAAERFRGSLSITRKEMEGLVRFAEYVDDGVAFVLSGNVKEGWIDTRDMRSISERHHATLGRSSLKSGDVLVTKTGVYFGNSAVVPKDFGTANTIAHVGIIRLKPGYDPTYVSTFLNSAYPRSGSCSCLPA